VAGLEARGDQVRVDLTGELEVTADLTAAAVAELRITPGERLWASVKAGQVHVYPA
jgi:molybdate transport system ATP-binding protein